MSAQHTVFVSVFWTESYVRHLLGGTTGADGDVLDKLLLIFGLDFRSQLVRTSHGGKGFFPPLAFLPHNGVLISPYFTWLFTHTRNVLYALHRVDQSKFDEVVSADMEPRLLRHAETMLRKLPGLEVKPNVIWKSSEIDLLVFEAATNTALQIQAKAPIAPYGARMVARLEDRIQEGIRQIQSFRALPQTQIDSVISSALGRQVTDVKLVDVILARSCFGTHRTWENAPGISFLSLTVLAELTRPERVGQMASIAELPQRAEEYLDAVVERARPIWTHKPLALRDCVVEVPMLEFDQRYLDEERRRVWS